MVTENEYYRDLRERSMIEVAIQDRVDDECEYKTVGPKSDTQQLADAQAENERLRELLQRAWQGVTDEDHEWFRDDFYTWEELDWIEATRRVLEGHTDGTHAAVTAGGQASSAAGS